jgi:predicted RNA-binding protein with PIN domain
LATITLARIDGVDASFVDTCSLLHSWPEIAAGWPRHSAAAREALVEKLGQYRDSVGTPISIFFHGSMRLGAGPKAHSSSGFEVLYSGGGLLADDVIERAAARFREYGEMLVVMNDVAERETVMAFCATAGSCDNFISMVQSALAEPAFDLKHHNRNERNRFHRPR